MCQLLDDNNMITEQKNFIFSAPPLTREKTLMKHFDNILTKNKVEDIFKDLMMKYDDGVAAPNDIA